MPSPAPEGVTTDRDPIDASRTPYPLTKGPITCPQQIDVLPFTVRDLQAKVTLPQEEASWTIRPGIGHS